VRWFLHIIRRPGSPWFWAFWVPVLVAATLAVFAFWPGLEYDWSRYEASGERQFGILRYVDGDDEWFAVDGYWIAAGFKRTNSDFKRSAPSGWQNHYASTDAGLIEFEGPGYSILFTWSFRR
jgi:hypothetical protein